MRDYLYRSLQMATHVLRSLDLTDLFDHAFLVNEFEKFSDPQPVGCHESVYRLLEQESKTVTKKNAILEQSSHN